MKDSTRKVFKRHGWRVDRAVHNYLYFVFYSVYVKGALLLTRVLVALFGRFERANIFPQFIFDRYHSKVVSRGDVKKMITLEEDVDFGSDTSIVPFKYANRILLKEPQNLAVMDCPCKKTLKDPCQPLASCIAVGSPVVDFWLEHCQHYHARRITPEEALEIIDAHRKTGHISMAFFKVATGGSMGVLCNCCPKCCVAMRATAMAAKIKGGEKNIMYAPSGYTALVDAEKCQVCGACADACNFGAVEMADGRRLFHPEKCLGCELCVEACENGAISLVLSGGPLLPLDMDMLRERVRQGAAAGADGVCRQPGSKSPGSDRRGN